MGSFAGHVFPGSLFLAYGLWWAFVSMWTHLKIGSGSQKQSRTKNKKDTTNPAVVSFFEYKRDHCLSRKSWLPQPFLPRIPLEPILKILLPVAGVIVEAFMDVRKVDGHPKIVWNVYKIYTEDGDLADLGKLQHITMYSAFLLSGIIDVLSLVIKFPHHTSQIFAAIAFWIEGILFYFHTQCRTELDVQIHFILTTVIFACAITAMLRIIQATNFLTNIAFTFGLILQGTWFIQVGYSLYPPSGKKWDEGSNPCHSDSSDSASRDHHNITMLISAYLTWHIVGIALGLLVLWVILSLVVKSNVCYRLARRTRGQKLHPPRNWVDTEEHERLITDDERGAVKEESQAVAMEMKEVETVT